MKHLKIVVLVVLGILGITFVSFAASKAGAAAGKRARIANQQQAGKHLPQVLPLNEVYARGWGATAAHSCQYDMWVDYAITRFDPQHVGLAMLDARRYFGEDFRVKFEPAKDKSGRRYTIMVCQDLH